MNSAQLCFPASPDTKMSVIESVHNVLASWYKHGQILEGWVIAERDTDIVAHVVLPAPDALAEEFSNRYVRADLAKLSAIDASPTIKLLGRYPDLDQACSCDSWDWLVLFTNYLAREPPLRCGRCFGPVPLYRIPPVHDDEHLGVLHWQADYKACDTLQMHTGTGERFAEQELFRHDSSLSLRGREVCDSLEQLAKIPVYYYLHRTRGRSRKLEQERTCPSCASAWLLPERLHIFDFRCDRCKLLSNIACNVK
jgi:predicted  nucleic acid-binding Zn ribbon protein